MNERYIGFYIKKQTHLKILMHKKAIYDLLQNMKIMCLNYNFVFLVNQLDILLNEKENLLLNAIHVDISKQPII